MKWLRFFALALVLMASMGLFGMAQIGIQVSASATQVCGTLYSHDLNVSWKVSGATARPNIAIVVTLPDGTSRRSSSDKPEGTISLPLEYPGGGSVSVQLQASTGGATASATASASLTPCAGPPPSSGPNLPELSGHVRDVENSLQNLLDKIFKSRQPTNPTQPPRDGVSRDTVNPGRASSCLIPVPTGGGRREPPPAGETPMREAPKRGAVAMPTRAKPLDKVSGKPVEGKPLGVVAVKPALPQTTKPASLSASVRRPPAAGTYALRAKKIVQQAQGSGASDQVAQSQYVVEFIDEQGNVVGEAPITNISEIPAGIADDEIDATVEPVLELGPDGQMEELLYTCIGKKFVVKKPDGTVVVECRGIEIIW